MLPPSDSDSESEEEEETKPKSSQEETKPKSSGQEEEPKPTSGQVGCRRGGAQEERRADWQRLDTSGQLGGATDTAGPREPADMILNGGAAGLQRPGCCSQPGAACRHPGVRAELWLPFAARPGRLQQRDRELAEPLHSAGSQCTPLAAAPSLAGRAEPERRRAATLQF